jgi:hypothetical protein
VREDVALRFAGFELFEDFGFNEGGDGLDDVF